MMRDRRNRGCDPLTCPVLGPSWSLGIASIVIAGCHHGVVDLDSCRPGDFGDPDDLNHCCNLVGHRCCLALCFLRKVHEVGSGHYRSDHFAPAFDCQVIAKIVVILRGRGLMSLSPW